MGGGAPPSSCGTELGLVVGARGGLLVALFRPKESADFLGGGASVCLCLGGGSILVCSSCVFCDLEGKDGAGFKLGLAGGGGVVPICFGCTLGEDLVDFKARLPAMTLLYFLLSASFCSCVLFGGRAGRADGSYAGALTE